MKIVKIVDKNGEIHWIKAEEIIRMSVIKLPIGCRQEYQYCIRLIMRDSGKEYCLDCPVESFDSGKTQMQLVADQINLK